MSEPIVAPFGSWRSPLTPADAAAAGVRFAGLAISRDAVGDPLVWWGESRPSEGRIVVVRGGVERTPVDVGPATLRTRSRVSEYGGGAFWVDGRHIDLVEEGSQRVLRHRLVEGDLPADGAWTPRWLTAAPPAPRAWRHASGQPLGSAWLVIERESHTDADAVAHPEARNEIVAVNCADGSSHPLVAASDPGGGDFAVAPAVSPDGTALAWLRWDHPDMPWDAAELWAAPLVRDGGRPVIGDARRVAGGAPGAVVHGSEHAVSVVLPVWSPDGELWWCDDATGWWHLRRSGSTGVPAAGSGDRAPSVVPGAQEEIGEPRWVAGGARYGITGDGRVVAVASADGFDSVLVIDPADGSSVLLPGPSFTSVEWLVVDGATVALVGGTGERPNSVWCVDLDTGEATDLRPRSTVLDPAWVSIPESVTFETGRPGSTVDPPVAHALVYPPTSGDHIAPPGERAPLVVRIHGGPTAAARPEFSTSVQFWTTRGFAVADVNYRGSVGYGRAYRDALRGVWGVADVEDCLAVATHLAESGRVDPERCVIRGGSSGGFTALAAVCFQSELGRPGAFGAACSLYGVTDLAALVADTHKFESRYLDGLVAPLPGGEQVYRERSPLHHADRLDRPVLLLQGVEDKVVPPAQAEVLVQALRANDVPHGYVRFEGEGHGFHLAATIVAALEVELGFYATVLGFVPDGVAPVELS